MERCELCKARDAGSSPAPASMRQIIKNLWLIFGPRFCFINNYGELGTDILHPGSKGLVRG